MRDSISSPDTSLSGAPRCTCDACGHRLPADAPGGLCPRCLRRGLLSEEPDEPVAATPKPGEWLGDYELLGEVARGGMGIVYRARQRGLDRIVALKLIESRQESSPEFLARFETEARAAASLDHPNVVPIYEIGEHEGRHFFTMKLVEGGSLGRRISDRQSPISNREAARLLATIARAVHHAHQRGVLHRDLKPSNILLDAQGEPHLTDFGLARLLAAESFVTRSRTAVGTPAYMSPEQAAGGSHTLTTASDIFSLGAILYELLSGCPPFLGDTPLETMRRVVEDQPEPPSVAAGKSEGRIPTAEGQPRPGNRSPSRLSTKLRVSSFGLLSGLGARLSDLDIICLKCLAKDPDARYPTALALAEDLERWLNGTVILARRATTPERLWRWARRNRAQAALTVAVLALLVVVAIGSTVAAWRIQRARDAARGQLARLLVAEGNRQMEADNPLLGLPAFVAALRVEPEPTARGIHRLRLGAVLRDAPELTAMLFVGAVINDLSLAPDGRNVLVGAADGSVRLWRSSEDVTLLLRAPQPMTTNPFGPAPVFLVTPMGKGSLSDQFFPEIDSVTFSPDGQLAAAAGWDGVARVWDASTGRALADGMKHEHIITRVVFSANGGWIATASADRTARVWHSRSGAPVCPPLRHEDDVLCVAFSPDGQWLATADAAGEIRTWRLPAGELTASARKHRRAVTSLAFDRAGRLLSGGADTLSVIWDAGGTLTIAHEVQLAPGGRASSPDAEGKFIVTTGGATPPGLYSRQSGALIAEMRGYGKHASFNQDGSRVARASAFLNTARVWDTATGQPLTPPLPHGNRVLRAVLDPAGAVLFTAAADGVVRRWRLRAAAQAEALFAGAKPGARAYPSRDGARWLVETKGHWRMFDSRSSRVEPSVLTFSNGVSHAVFCANDERLAVASADGRHWQMFSLPDGKALSPAHPVDGRILRFAVEPGGGTVAFVLAERPDCVEVRTTADGRRTFAAPLTGSSPVSHLEFGADSQRLLVAFGRTVLLADAMSGQPVATLAHPGTIEAARFSPDGRRFVTACTSASLEPLFARVWSARDGRAVSPPLRHADGVVTASFDLRGERVVTGGEDALARVWDAVSGHPLSGFLHTSSGGFVYSTVISPDGLLVAASQSVSIKQARYRRLLLWEAATGQPLGGLPLLDGSITDLAWLPDSRHIAGFHPGSGVWRCRLPETPLTLEQLETLVTILTAHRVDLSSSLVPVEASELKQTWQKWRGHPAAWQE